MASSWGYSWSSAWNDSWGIFVPLPPPGYIALPSPVNGLVTAERGGFLGRERQHGGAQAIMAPVLQHGDSGRSGFLDRHRP